MKPSRLSSKMSLYHVCPGKLSCLLLGSMTLQLIPRSLEHRKLVEAVGKHVNFRVEAVIWSLINQPYHKGSPAMLREQLHFTCFFFFFLKSFKWNTPEPPITANTSSEIEFYEFTCWVACERKEEKQWKRWGMKTEKRPSLVTAGRQINPGPFGRDPPVCMLPAGLPGCGCNYRQEGKSLCPISHLLSFTFGLFSSVSFRRFLNLLHLGWRNDCVRFQTQLPCLSKVEGCTCLWLLWDLFPKQPFLWHESPSKWKTKTKTKTNVRLQLESSELQGPGLRGPPWRHPGSANPLIQEQNK